MGVGECACACACACAFKSITKYAIVLSVRFAAILKLRFS